MGFKKRSLFFTKKTKFKYGMNHLNINNNEDLAAKDYLDKFYENIVDFLVANQIENQPCGFSEKEISNYEIEYKISFPKAYRLFLALLAKSDLKIFSFQDFTISGLKGAQEVSQELQVKDNFQLESYQFAFTQWQDYNFFYLDLRSNNPNVELYIQAGCASEESPAEIYKYGSFTDWLCNMIEISLTLRKQLNGLEINQLLTDLEQIKQDAKINEI